MTSLGWHRPAAVIRLRAAAALRGERILGFLVLAYVALLPFQLPINNEINFAPADVFLLLILPLAAASLKYCKPAWSAWHSALPLVFIISTFFCALRNGSLSRYVWLNKDVGLLLLLFSYLTITSVATDWEQVRQILRVFTLSVVVQNQVAIVSFGVAYARGIDTVFTMYDGRRLAGLLLDPNAYGGLLGVALAICEGASWGEAPLFRRGLLLYCRLNLLLGILFTFSRSAWISLSLSLLLLCAFRTTKAIQLALAVLVAAPCVLLLMGPGFLLFFEDMAGRPERGISRFELIRDAWTQFTQHPILGGGIGSFVDMEGTIVHNTTLWFLADFGIPGFAVLLGFLGWFLFAGWFAYGQAPLKYKPIVCC